MHLTHRPVGMFQHALDEYDEQREPVSEDDEQREPACRHCLPPDLAYNIMFLVNVVAVIAVGVYCLS